MDYVLRLELLPALTGRPPTNGLFALPAGLGELGKRFPPTALADDYYTSCVLSLKYHILRHDRRVCLWNQGHHHQAKRREEHQ